MVGPKDIRGRLPPGVTPALNQTEQAQVKQDKKDKLRSQDASRLAQQAGFQKVDKGKKKKLALGDSSQAPIPLPDDDLDPDAWSQQGLESAEQALSSADAKIEQAFSEVQEGAEGRGLGLNLLESSFVPVEEDLGRLKAISEREAEMGEENYERLKVVGKSVGALFGIQFGDNTPVAHQVMAAGLVVAGEPETVVQDGDNLDEKKLANGVQKVTSNGNKAVRKAKSMNQGIGKELSVHRTMVFKR